MKVELIDNAFDEKNIRLSEDSKVLIITFSGALDLHWLIANSDCDKNEQYSYDSFNITKENYKVYLLFEKLFYNIKNLNIFDDEETKNYSDYKLQKQKSYYKNTANYDKLYDNENKTITWVSDETNERVANYVKIHKLKDEFLIEFFTQPYIEGYEREYNYFGEIGIRFRNSGSRYDPFNCVFMRMYREMQNIDDINDYGHQMYIEEYLYQEDKVKKLKLNKKQ